MCSSKITIIGFFCIFTALLLVAGCTSSETKHEVIATSDNYAQNVNYIESWTVPVDSNNDGLEDGLEISLSLLDSNFQKIRVSNINLPLEITVQNTLTEEGHIMPKYKTDVLTKLNFSLQGSPDQKFYVHFKDADFSGLRPYKDTPGLYFLVIEEKLTLPDGRVIEREDVANINRIDY
jgi:hypothetical protein